MNRLEKFNSFESHGWLHKAYKKLSKTELDIAKGFIHENDALNKGDFEFAVNRMFTGKTDLPKNWSVILELLTCCNSAIEDSSKKWVHPLDR